MQSYSEDGSVRTPKAVRKTGWRWIGSAGLAIGLVLGAGLTAALGWTVMPSMMMHVHESRYATVDQTCQALQQAIEAEGWNCPAVRDMNTAMSRHGVTFDHKIRIVELCKAEYAHDVLSDQREMAAMMPCAFGVYEGNDGKVYVSGMNTGLMGKMFGGTVAEVMGRSVARDEQRILAAVIR